MAHGYRPAALKAYEPRLCSNCTHTHRMAHRAMTDQLARTCGDCPECRLLARVRVINRESTFLGLRGEIRRRHVHEDGTTLMIRLDGWDLDLPFGESEIEEETVR